MGVESDADRLAFLDLSEFAVEAVWRGSKFPVIFDRPSELVALGEVGFDAEKPQATARTSDVRQIPVDAVISIDGVNYVLTRAHQPDGTGISMLYLRDAD